MRRSHAALAIAVALMLAAQAARANDTVHVGKAQGTAWTFLPVDIGIEQGIFGKLGLPSSGSESRRVLAVLMFLRS